MKRLILIFLPLILQGQQQAEELVTVPKRYVSAEGLSHTSEAPEFSKWVGIGREIGIATKEGLNSVVDVSERFGTTSVGHFVMFMVAWRIVGKDLMGIFIGIPLFVGGVCIWLWSYRRFFFSRRVCIKAEKGLKEWQIVPPYKFESGEAKTGCACAHVGAILIWAGVMIGAVIF